MIWTVHMQSASGRSDTVTAAAKTGEAACALALKDKDKSEGWRAVWALPFFS